jgi:putative transposase
MCRGGTCHDNTVAEGFFNPLKRDRIRRRISKTHEQARQDIFDHIELFDNPKHKRDRTGILLPDELENTQRDTNQEGI